MSMKGSLTDVSGPFITMGQVTSRERFSHLMRVTQARCARHQLSRNVATLITASSAVAALDLATLACGCGLARPAPNSTSRTSARCTRLCSRALFATSPTCRAFCEPVSREIGGSVTCYFSNVRFLQLSIPSPTARKIRAQQATRTNSSPRKCQRNNEPRHWRPLALPTLSSRTNCPRTSSPLHVTMTPKVKLLVSLRVSLFARDNTLRTSA